MDGMRVFRWGMLWALLLALGCAWAVNPMPAARPDLAIRNNNQTAFAGDNIYNLDGAGQTRAQEVPLEATVKYILRVQNDAAVTDAITLRGSLGDDKWAIRFYDLRTNTEVTTAVGGVGWSTGPLAPGATVELRIQVSPNHTTYVGFVFDLPITATSGNDPARQDVARAVSTAVMSYQSDMWIRNASDPDFIGENLWSTGGQKQTKTQISVGNSAVVFVIRVQNDATSAHVFKITGTPGGAGWTVGYFAADGSEVTWLVTGKTGWLTRRLAPGEWQEFTLSVAGDATVAAGTMQELLVSAWPTLGPIMMMKDVVKAVVYKDGNPLAIPDLRLRGRGETLYGGDNVYETDGATQVRAYTTSAGVFARYLLKVQNDGLLNGSFTLQASAGGNGWSVRYLYQLYDQQIDVTPLITSTAGWTLTNIRPGANLSVVPGLTVEVIPDSSAPVGGVNTLLISAANPYAPTILDTVRLVTTRK